MSKGAIPSASPEAISEMIVVTETQNYKLVVFSPELREQYDSNYGIVNKQYDVIEAMYGALFAALQIIRELQTKLDQEMPKASPVLRSIH